MLGSVPCFPSWMMTSVLTTVPPFSTNLLQCTSLPSPSRRPSARMLTSLLTTTPHPFRSAPKQLPGHPRVQVRTRRMHLHQLPRPQARRSPLHVSYPSSTLTPVLHDMPFEVVLDLPSRPSDFDGRSALDAACHADTRVAASPSASVRLGLVSAAPAPTRARTRRRRASEYERPTVSLPSSQRVPSGSVTRVCWGTSNHPREMRGTH
jgi:hypothetical protein